MVVKLKKKLDAVFSRWVRLSHARPDGLVACYTCGRLYHWKKIHAGHYISRSYLSTRWDEMNVRPQCYSCNIHRHGASVDFREALVDEYGEDAVRELEARRNDIVKLDEAWYQDRLIHYTELVKKLERDIL